MVISKVILLGLLTVTTLLESGEGGGVAMASKKGSVDSLCISMSRSTPRTRISLC